MGYHQKRLPHVFLEAMRFTPRQAFKVHFDALYERILHLTMHGQFGLVLFLMHLTEVNFLIIVEANYPRSNN